MIRGKLESSHNRDSNPSGVHGLFHSSVNHSAASFLAAALFPHRTSSPHDRKHLDLHLQLHANQSFSGQTPPHDGASSRHGFPRKSHVFDDVIRPSHHVHSLTTVGVMTGVIVFLTIGATAALALFCCRRSFRLAAKDDEQPEDVEDCQLDEIDVIYDDDDVIPLFLSSDSGHMTRTRLELRQIDENEAEVTFDGVVQQGQVKTSAGQRSQPRVTTWNRRPTYRPLDLKVLTPEQIHHSYENSDPETATFRPPLLTSEKPEEDNDVTWRASSESTGYPALADGCRDGYRRIDTEEEVEEEEEEQEEDETAAMETSLEDNNSMDADFESAEND